MKKYLKYIIGGLVYFLVMVLFNYLFQFGIDLKIIIGSTIIYLILNIIFDYFLKFNIKS